jgi:hypothetical protein
MIHAIFVNLIHRIHEKKEFASGATVEYSVHEFLITLEAIYV